jgi:hypothetical protein
VLAFQERALSLKGGLSVMRNSNDIRAIDSDITFPANGCQSYQWKIGSEYIPAQEVSCVGGAGRALAEIRKHSGGFGDPTFSGLITQDNLSPHDLPHQLDQLDLRELRRAASEPSKFIIPLDLEKSRGQASGFDSAASSVDVELIIRLEKHEALVGTNAGTDVGHFSGALAGSLWQPSKKRVTYDRWTNNDYGTVAKTIGLLPGSMNTFIFNTTADKIDTNTALPNISFFASGYPDIPEGFMRTKNATFSVTSAVSATVAGQYTTRVLKESGIYARMYFFAHLDQVLRLSAVGRMEIVR